MTSFGERLYASFMADSQAKGRKLDKMEFIELANRQYDICEKEWEKRRKERKKAGIHPDAERVYELYPKKTGREAALVEITKALTKHPLEYLLDKTAQFAACVAAWPSSYRYFQDGGDRVWNPVNFFKDGHHEDDPKEWKRSGSRAAPPPVKHNMEEPIGWKAAFPDFIHADKAWSQLDLASQSYICETMKRRNTG